MIAIGIEKEGDVYSISGFSLTEGPINHTVQGREEAEKFLRPMLVTYRRTGHQVIVEDATGEFTQLLHEIDPTPPNIIKVDWRNDDAE